MRQAASNLYNSNSFSIFSFFCLSENFNFNIGFLLSFISSVIKIISTNNIFPYTCVQSYILPLYICMLIYKAPHSVTLWMPTTATTTTSKALTKLKCPQRCFVVISFKFSSNRFHTTTTTTTATLRQQQQQQQLRHVVQQQQLQQHLRQRFTT